MRYARFVVDGWLAFWVAIVGCSTVWMGHVMAEPISEQRLREWKDNQPAWIDYLKRSQAAAEKDEAALKAELDANKMSLPIRAPEGGDFKLTAKNGDVWFASAEAHRLADVILSYQTPSGGWSKHTGYSRGPRQPGMQWTSQNEPGKPSHYLATFDNRSTTEQLWFLANVGLAHRRADCQTAVVKGLEFILAAQYPNGGWPQVYPLEGEYHDDITFNDDAMTHVLELLKGIEDGLPIFQFIEAPLRARVRLALHAGIGCVFKAQVFQNGKRTVWCAQHDALTLEPSRARKLEPPTLSGLESAHLLRFLMKIDQPTGEQREAIGCGLEWLEKTQINGLRKTKVDGRTAYVADPSSTEVYWARFYDLKDSHPVFPGRNGVLYDSFEAMAAENKLGYDFYTTLPGSILKSGLKKWKAK